MACDLLSPWAYADSSYQGTILKNLAQKIRARLARETSTGLFLPEVDGLRFVAVLSVFVFHLSAYLQSHSPMRYEGSVISSILCRIASEGRFGVQLFFVISGLILSLPFAAQHLEKRAPVRLKAYFLRRLTRIEPPYIINMLLAFILLVFINKKPAMELLPHLFASLAYVHNIAFAHASVLNVVAWSLEIEVQFYLVAPLLASVFVIQTKWLRRSAILLAVATVMILETIYQPAISSLFGVLPYFLVGFLLADMYLTEWKNCCDRRGLWDLIATSAWLSIIGLQWHGSNRSFLLPAAIFFAYAGAFRGRLFNQLFCNRWLVVIGGMCYTIYLYHPFIISLFGRVLLRYSLSRIYWVHFLVLAIVIGFLTLVLCSALFCALEKPFMRRDWPTRCWSALRALSRRRRSPATLKLPAAGSGDDEVRDLPLKNQPLEATR